jgi:hypothetical protein
MGDDGRTVKKMMLMIVVHLSCSARAGPVQAGGIPRQ